MSSDLYTFDISYQRHSSPDNMVSYDGNGNFVFFSDPHSFPFLTGSPIDDVVQGNFNTSLDPFSSSFCSFSPQENPVQPLSNIKGEFRSFSYLHGSEVTSKECQMGVDYTYNQHFISQTCHGSESASKLIQRSFSCTSFDEKPRFPFEPHPDTLMDFQWHALNSPENTFFAAQMRRVCSTGDLQVQYQTLCIVFLSLLIFIRESKNSLCNPFTNLHVR